MLRTDKTHNKIDLLFESHSDTVICHAYSYESLQRGGRGEKLAIYETREETIPAYKT